MKHGNEAKMLAIKKFRLNVRRYKMIQSNKNAGIRLLQSIVI